MKKSLLVLLTALCGNFAIAKDPSSCLNEADSKKIMKHFGIQLESVDLCDSKNPSYLLLETLLLAKNLLLSDKEIPAPWNQSVLPKKWYEHLQEAIPYMYTQTPYHESNCPGTLAFTLNEESHRKNIFLCEAFFEPSVLPIERLSTLLHEARHQEGDRHAHVICKKGPHKNEQSCDPDIASKGSYAVDTEALVKIGLLSENLSSTTQRLALLQGMSREVHFNQSPFADSRVVYLRDEQEQVFAFNGKTLEPVILPEFAHSRLYAVPFVNSLLAVYNDNALKPLTAATFDGQKFDLQTQQIELGYSRNVHDLLWTEHFHAKITANMILQRNYVTGAMTKLTWPSEEQPLHLVSSEDIGLSSPDVLYILTDKDKMYRLKLNTSLIKGQTNHELSEVKNLYAGFKAFATMGRKTFLLSHTGQLYEQASGKTVPFKGLENIKFIEMTRSLKTLPASAVD